MDFLELARSRYSVRKYKTAPVEDEKIALILEAARLAPTACNYQPQKIFVAKSEEARAKLAKVSPCTFNAPVVFVVGYDDTRCAKGRVAPDHDFGDTDAAIACTHMTLEAAQLGLGSCWVGMFVEEDVRQALGIPANVRIRELLPVGYPADDAAPAPLHEKSRELSDIVTEL